MSTGAGKRRRLFTPEYRREAAHLVLDTGRPIAHVAREIGVGEQLLGRWVATERHMMGSEGEPVVTESERMELERLRQENHDLKMENEFLGKAASLVASRSTSRPVTR